MNKFTKGDLVRKGVYYGNVIKVFRRHSELLIRWEDDPDIERKFSVEKVKDVTLAYGSSHDASLLSAPQKT